MYGADGGNSVAFPRGPMLSFSNAIKSKSTIIGAALSLGSVACAQIVARSGFDWVLIDMEHAPTSPREATQLTHAVVAASAGRCIPLIRAPSHGVEWTKWALDSGAAGIIVPMVNHASQAEDIVQHAIYPPAGQRSFGPFLAPFADTDSSSDVGTYLAKRAPEVSIIVMIESAEGVKNAGQILSVRGVTGCFIGPFDLRQSLGLSGGDGEEPEFVEALAAVVNVCKRLGLDVGTVAGDEGAVRRKSEMGFSFLLSGSDVAFLGSAANSSRKQCMKGLRVTKDGKL